MKERGFAVFKLKSEIFNNKKSLYTKMFFSIITKNLNWKILTNNLVTFKGWVWAKIKNYKMWVHQKTQILGGEFTKKPIYWGIA